MKFRNTMKAKKAILFSSIKSGISYADCRKEIAAAIDEAWETDDPEAKAFQDRLFPGGKPSPEQFIATLGSRIQKQQ